MRENKITYYTISNKKRVVRVYGWGTTLGKGEMKFNNSSKPFLVSDQKGASFAEPLNIGLECFQFRFQLFLSSYLARGIQVN